MLTFTEGRRGHFTIAADGGKTWTTLGLQTLQTLGWPAEMTVDAAIARAAVGAQAIQAAEQPADPRRDGALQERERFASILGLAEANGRRKSALAIALTGASVDQARAVLAASGKDDDQQPAADAGTQGFAFGFPVDSGFERSHGWKKATDRVNRARGFQV